MNAANLPVLVLKRNEDRRLRAGHLWIYSNEVDTGKTPLTAFTPGAAIVIQSATGKTLGAGYVNPHSLLCARLLSRKPRKEIHVEQRARLAAEQARAQR